MGLIVELILGALLEKEAVEFRSRKSLLLYAICRNLVGLALSALLTTIVWWCLVKGGITLYLFALLCGGLLVFQVVSLYAWNQEAFRRFRFLKRESQDE